MPKGKITPKEITQFCLPEVRVIEVLKMLPKKVKIVSLAFESGIAVKRVKKPVSIALEKCGVRTINETDPSLCVYGIWTGSREKMKEDLDLICNELGIPINTVRVKRMEVTVGKNAGTFHKIQKHVEGDDEKLRRQTVLALVKWDGQEKAVAQACNANTFACKYDIQTIRTVICKEK